MSGKCPFLLWLKVNRVDISKYPPILLKLAWTEKCPLIRWVDSGGSMLCRTDDGRGFILNPYLDEMFKTRANQRRRYYFEQGLLTVKRYPFAENIFVLRYKGDYVASWWASRESVIVAHDLIAAVCRTLDIERGVRIGD